MSENPEVFGHNQAMDAIGSPDLTIAIALACISNQLDELITLMKEDREDG